jgi:hypothetical protein
LLKYCRFKDCGGRLRGGFAEDHHWGSARQGTIRGEDREAVELKREEEDEEVEEDERKARQGMKRKGGEKERKIVGTAKTMTD